LWLREDSTPFYIGKGKGSRAFRNHWRGGRLAHVPPPKNRIVIYPAESEADAIETEIALIWYYGRKDLGTGCLRNLTEGGEGVSALSEECRGKISASLMGHGFTEATLHKMSEAKKGKHLSREHVRNLVAASKHRPPILEETRTKQSAAAKLREQGRRNKLISMFGLTHEQDFLIKTLVNLVKRRESARIWSKANPEKVKEMNARRYKK